MSAVSEALTDSARLTSLILTTGYADRVKGSV
jgi:hypothetical protein